MTISPSSRSACRSSTSGIHPRPAAFELRYRRGLRREEHPPASLIPLHKEAPVQLISLVFTLALSAAISAALPHGAMAQSQITTGVIQGDVRDATGALLPGVTVAVTNTDTNLTQTRVTETNGRFVFLQLPPGRYRATFTLT